MQQPTSTRLSLCVLGLVTLGVTVRELLVPLLSEFVSTAFAVFTSYSLIALVALVAAGRLKRWIENAHAAHLQETGALQQIGLMTAGIAHNFRNYLNILDASHCLLEKHIPDTIAPAQRPLEMQRKCLLQARHAVDLLMRLVKQERPSAAIHIGSRPVTEIIEESVELAELLFRQKNINVRREVHAAPTTLRVNDASLTQSLINVLKNAAEASPENALLIVTSSVKREGDKEKYCISVRDQGEGIDELTLKRLFAKITSGKKDGTGLGLLSVKELIERDGGEVEIQSEPSQGTAVTFKYPIYDC